MEPSGRNQWQPVANATASKPAQTSRSATGSNPRQRFRSARTVDDLLAKEGGAFLAPRREVESRDAKAHRSPGLRDSRPPVAARYGKVSLMTWSFAPVRLSSGS
jgi:hypothetical protein